MYCPTADTLSSIRFRRPAGTFLLQIPADIGSGEGEAYQPAVREPSNNRPDILSGPTPIPANWLATVERRIRDSINPYDVEYINDGRWLRTSIASQAMSFFQRTSDVLPGEPYIYSSIQGDLVAEFKSSHGSMTNIVGLTSVIAFAVIDGAVFKEKLELRNDNLAETRQELQRLTEKLRTGQHGAVDSTK